MKGKEHYSPPLETIFKLLIAQNDSSSHKIRIERSVSACFFKITIFSISFSNAK